MPRILLVEPSGQARVAMARFLLERDYGCIAVADPEELREDDSEEQIDLLILAIHEETEDGVEMVRQLHADPVTSQMPILAIVDGKSFQFTEDLFAVGVTACLSRPFKLGALEKTIESVFLDESDVEALDAGLSVPAHLGQTYAKIREEGRELGDIAEIYTGLQPRMSKFRRLASPSPDWTPALVEESIQPFYVSDAREYFLVNRVGVVRRPAEEEYHVPEKIVLRRTLSPLTVAIDTQGHLIASELYSIIPVKGLLCGYVACVLMSRMMDFYFHRVRPPAEGLRGVYLSRADLEAIPLQIIKPDQQAAFAKLAVQISSASALAGAPKKAIERGRLLSQMNKLVFDAYGFDEQAVRQISELHY